MDYNLVARRVSKPGHLPAVSVQVARASGLGFDSLVRALDSLCEGWNLPVLNPDQLAGRLDQQYDELLEVTEVAYEVELTGVFVGQSIQINILGFDQ